jgi:hypothetical protein
MHRATPSKTSTSLVAATRKRRGDRQRERGERERERERTELLAAPVRKFISETESSQRTDSRTEHRRARIFRMPREIPPSYYLRPL